MAGVVERKNVWVAQTGDDLDLPQEALRSQRHGQIWGQDLERDLAAVLAVNRQVHGDHASAPQLFLMGVSGGEGTADSVERVGHGPAAPSGMSWVPTRCGSA